MDKFFLIFLSANSVLLFHVNRQTEKTAFFGEKVFKL